MGNDGFGNVPMTLELSASHHIITTLLTIKESNEPVARIAAEQLFDNACVAAGTLDDPRVLMARLNKVLEMFIYQGAGFDYARNEYVTNTAAKDTAAVTQDPPTTQDEKKTPGDSQGSEPKFDEAKPKFEESKPKFEEVKTSA